MQQAVLHTHVLVFFVSMESVHIKPSIALRVFNTEQVVMFYFARKHKKQPAPSSCLTIKHIYAMMSMPVLIARFRPLSQKSRSW